MTILQTAGRVLRSLAKGAGLASSRFPAAAVLVVAMAVIANAEVAGHSLVPVDDLGRLLGALYAGAAASVVLRLFLESHGWAPGLRAGVPVLAALAIAAAVWFSRTLGLHAPALVAALTFAVFPAPYVGRPDDRRFWVFTLWTSVGVALAFASVLLFVLGVSAILEMIRFLFEIGPSSRAYEHIYTTALTLVGPLIALGRIPADFDETVPAVAEDRMAQGVRFLLDWVAAPLTLATAVVLHLYALKIVALGSLPQNEVGWIVTAFAVLALSLRIAADPFIEGGGVFTRGFARVWAAMLVVPLALLVIALAERVGPQGWTLERYYLALGAAAIGLVVAVQIVPRLRRRIRLIAGVPLALLALSSFGPWGVSDTVGRSQAARLATLVSPQPSADAVAEASSRIAALEEVDELGRALALVPESARGDLGADVADRDPGAGLRIAAALGLETPPVADDASAIKVFASGRETPFGLSGFDVALFDRAVFAKDAPDVDRTQAILVQIDGPDLLVTVDGASERFDMTPVVQAVPGNGYEADAATLAPLDVNLFAASGRTIRLRVRSLSVRAAGERALALTGTVLLRRSDWPNAASLGGLG